MRLDIAETALESLKKLQAYWALFNTDEKVQARIDALLDEAIWLCDWPGAGSQEIFMEHRGIHYRKWVVGKVKIIYYIHGDTLRISDFFDSRQDPDKMQGQ